MKYNILYIVLLLLSLQACKDHKNETDKLTEITLHFTNYNPAKHKNFIDIKIENLIDPIQKQLKISDSGFVNYTFINPRVREAVFSYEYNEFSLIVPAGGKVRVDLTVNELLNSSKLTRFKVLGENHETNELILSNTAYLDSLGNESTSPMTQDSSLSNMEYYHKRLAEMRSHLKIFNNYIDKSNINDKLFIDWAHAKIRYKAGLDLALYPFMGKYAPKLSASSPYFSFTNEIMPPKNDLLVYDSYLNYLDWLSKDYRIMGNISTKYQTIRTRLKKNSKGGTFPMHFKLLNMLPEGREREIMLAYAAKKAKTIPKGYMDSLRNHLNGPLLSMVLKEPSKVATPIKTLIANYDISQKEKNELFEIYKSTKGKVIFHDFWFTNCAPCMRELPHYNELIKLAGKDVVFIFFGAYMDRDEWMETIEKFGLQGRHHLLTKNQLAFFERYFGVSAFPHHQIVDSQGKIVDEQIYNINPNHFKQIVSQIEKHRADN